MNRLLRDAPTTTPPLPSGTSMADALEGNPVDLSVDGGGVKKVFDERGWEWNMGQHVSFTMAGRTRYGRIDDFSHPSSDMVGVWFEGEHVDVDIQADNLQPYYGGNMASGDDRKRGKRSLDL